MVTETKKGVRLDIELPDITKEVKEAFESFYLAMGSDTKATERSFDAWLENQKEEGIVSFYRQLEDERTKHSVS